jgi:hypothetical protein
MLGMPPSRENQQNRNQWLERGIASYSVNYINGNGSSFNLYNDSALNYTESKSSSALFLKWLTDNKRKLIVQELNLALVQGTYVS